MASPTPLLPPQVVSLDAFLSLESHGERLQELRSFVNARLAVVVEDILLAVEKTVAKYRYEYQSMQRDGVELKEDPPGADGAMGPVKEEQILVNINHTFTKEGPGTFPLCAQFPLGSIKEETPEESEEKWHILLHSKTPPDQNQDQGLNQSVNQSPNQSLNQSPKQSPNQSPNQSVNQSVNQSPNQDHGLSQDLEQGWEERVAWEFEGLFPGDRSPEQTEHSSEEEPPPKRGTARPDHCSITTVNLGPKVKLSSTALNHLTLNHVTQNPVVMDSGDEVTENSSDFSDSETKRSKSVTERSLNAGTQCCDVLTNEERGKAKAKKRKKLNRRMPKKGEKMVAVKEGAANTSHTSSTSKRMCNSLQKVTPPYQTPPGQTMPHESQPYAICGKSFKSKSSVSRALRVHVSHSRKEEKREVMRGGADKSMKGEEKKRKRESVQKRERERERERMQGSNKRRTRRKTRETVEERGKKGGEGPQKREIVEKIQMESAREKERGRETDNETDTDQTRDSSDEN